MLANADGFGFFQWAVPVEGEGEEDRAPAGSYLTVRAKLENLLVPGRHFIHCGIARNHTPGDTALYVHNAIEFVVFGIQKPLGLVSMPHDTSASLTRRT